VQLDESSAPAIRSARRPCHPSFIKKATSV
jgi:hypothetical protein